MGENVSTGQDYSNVDLLRTLPQTLETRTIVAALGWLDGKTSYPFPVSIHVDLTQTCNSHCRHCSQWRWPRRPEFTLDQIENLFGIFKTWGVQTVTLGGGNPLLHSDIISALEIAAKANLRIGVITEGVYMPEQLAEAICKHVEWIRFSIDGPTAEIHDRIRGKKGLFDQAVGNIKCLKSIKSDLNLGINCVVQKLNYKYLDGMFQLTEQLHVNSLSFKLPHGKDPNHHYLLEENELTSFEKWLQNPDRWAAYSVTTNIKQLGFMFENVVAKGDILRGTPVRDYYRNNRISCYVPLFLLVCDSEGNIFPCDYLQADTRPWEEYQEVRTAFCLGNVLKDEQLVLSKLETLMREKIHALPRDGYDECGCCTRFYQLNTWMSKIQEDATLQETLERRSQEQDIHQMNKAQFL